MKFTGRAQIETLTQFKTENFPVTSFYLDTDKSRLSKKEISVSLKQVLNEGKARLEAMDFAREKKESLALDLEKISAFCAQNLGSFNHAGLALFACSRKGFWLPLFLPHGPRNRFVVGQNFYVRPLPAILDKYRRICVFLISRREARWYEVYMGEITPLDRLASDVPGRVKKGGYEGNESRRIERHIEAHVLEHFKKASRMTFDIFKKNHFVSLFLGCEDDSFPILEPLLHAYVKDRLKGRMKAKPADSAAAILKEAEEIENGLKTDEESEVVKKLIAELERGGRACSGVRETLQRLNQFEVQTLVVTHNYSKEGRVCPNCKFLYLEDEICPVCRRKTDPVTDVIDEAIETALKHKCTVKQIDATTRLDRYGRVGAFLKYKM
jgi:peptide subunit release factor 1 (eRF1)